MGEAPADDEVEDRRGSMRTPVTCRNDRRLNEELAEPIAVDAVAVPAVSTCSDGRPASPLRRRGGSAVAGGGTDSDAGSPGTGGGEGSIELRRPSVRIDDVALS